MRPADLHQEPPIGWQVVILSPDGREQDRSWRTTSRDAAESMAQHYRDVCARRGWNYTVRVEGNQP